MRPGCGAKVPGRTWRVGRRRGQKAVESPGGHGGFRAVEGVQKGCGGKRQRRIVVNFCGWEWRSDMVTISVTLGSDNCCILQLKASAGLSNWELLTAGESVQCCQNSLIPSCWGSGI